MSGPKTWRTLVRVRHPDNSKVHEPGDHIVLTDEQVAELGAARFEDPNKRAAPPVGDVTPAQLAALAEQKQHLEEELRTLKLENHRLASDKNSGMSLAEQLQAKVAELESQNAAMRASLEKSAPRPNSPKK